MLGAHQVVRGDRALAEADELDHRAGLQDLPLAGLPIAVKDNVAVTGEPMRNGSAASDLDRGRAVVVGVVIHW